MTDLPRRLLHLEGPAVAAGALVLYFDAGHGWLLLVLLALAPDLSMLGYFGGPRVGALAYDLVHTYVGPVALGVVGVVGDARRQSRSRSSGSCTSAPTVSSATG
jgi:uncharacterized protein DUF4260